MLLENCFKLRVSSDTMSLSYNLSSLSAGHVVWAIVSLSDKLLTGDSLTSHLSPCLLYLLKVSSFLPVGIGRTLKTGSFVQLLLNVLNDLNKEKNHSK